jgi:hypothetical protein
MDVGKSVSKAIAECLGGDLESAMLHACNAVDGTATKVYPALGVGARFTTLLRTNYASVLEPMMPGVNLAETAFPMRIPNASAPGGLPDVADVLYVIHRCNHGHGAPLPSATSSYPTPPPNPQALA